MKNTRFICYTTALVSLLSVCQIAPGIARSSAASERFHSARRHAPKYPPVQLEALCKIPALPQSTSAIPGTPAPPQAGYVSTLEMSAVVRNSANRSSWQLLGFNMRMMEFTGKKWTSIHHSTLNIQEARGLSHALGNMLAHASRWQDQDIGYRGLAFATRSGFELQFYQNENRMQNAFAVCNPGGNNKFIFGGVRQLAQLKQSIDGRLLAWHAAQVAGRYISDWQPDANLVAAR